MPSCLQCLSRAASRGSRPGRAPQNWVLFSDTEPAALGDIYGVLQSVKTPIRLILARSLGFDPGDGASVVTANSPFGSARAVSRAAPSWASTVPGAGKIRPCIIRNTAPAPKAMTNVYLMATYNDKPFDELPKIYQHFSLAVYPNQEHAVHLHTQPEWQGKEVQWVIAYRFPIMFGKENTRWTNTWVQHPGNCYLTSHHRIGEDMLEWLNSVADRKMDEWQRMCTKDPRLISQMFKDCRIKSDDARKQARAGVARWRTHQHALTLNRNASVWSAGSNLSGLASNGLEHFRGGAQNMQRTTKQTWDPHGALVDQSCIDANKQVDADGFTVVSYGKRRQSHGSSVTSGSYRSGQRAQ
ncbi:uncharacterized protein B0H18DRAFT_982093 [Fomitopsis serialis]|uniref:uncharacterized protein n=1 Tax=Fomitopsis serialis TaxID=139415 RepID=UPI002007C91B|nr:uncharacterized protein B0H18DRAFT_982093 [Neoantrodia serialis]KAH9933800.1 hypothetical protein B0H18DRAFT_982093 [Neoantrodia serialis]